MVYRTWTWAAIGLLTVYGFQRAARLMRSRRLATQAPKGEERQVWEGEGGAVPVAPNRIAAAVTPSSMAGTDNEEGKVL